MFGTEYTIWYMLLNLLIMLIGVIAHFFKKKIKGETIADIKAYFKNHFKNTALAFISAIVLFISLAATGGLGAIASFTAGYASDSLFNRAESASKK